MDVASYEFLLKLHTHFDDYCDAMQYDATEYVLGLLIKIACDKYPTIHELKTLVDLKLVKIKNEDNQTYKLSKKGKEFMFHFLNENIGWVR